MKINQNENINSLSINNRNQAIRCYLRLSSKSKLSIYNSIKPYMSGKKFLAYLFVLRAVSLAVTVAAPIFYKIMIDDVLIGGKFELIWVVAIGYAAVYFCEAGIIAAEKFCSNKAYVPTVIKLQSKIMDIMNSLSITALEKFGAGDLKNRITSDSNIEGFFYHHVLEYIYSVIISAVTAVILLFIDWRLALISYITVPVSFWMTKFLGKKKLSASKELRTERAKFDSYTHAAIQNWKEVKILNLENSEDKTFNYHRETVSKLFIKNQIYWFLNRTFISIKDFFVTKMNLYFIGGLFIFSGGLSVGSLLIFMVYFDKMFSALETINDLDMRYTGDRVSLEKVVEILEMEQPFGVKEDLHEVFKSLKFSNVTFSYGANLPETISNLSFEINKGDKAAFSGKSGCGKSTILKLILNMYEANSGEILINGKNINNISNKTIQRMFGAVMQEPYLLNLSIRENLLLADGKATERQMTDCLKKAAVYDFVLHLPNGLDTIIGEKGIKLSGGQRQRLAIARTLLRNTDVFIFDEATSALDHESEKKVHEAISNIKAEKTVILVSHRPSSLALSGKVFYIGQN